MEKYLQIQDTLKKYLETKCIFNDSLNKELIKFILTLSKVNIYSLFAYNIFKIFNLSEKRNLLLSSIIFMLEIRRNFDKSNILFENKELIQNGIFNIISYILTHEMKLSEKIKLLLLSKIEEYKVNYNVHLYNLSHNLEEKNINKQTKSSVELFHLIIEIISIIKTPTNDQIHYLMMYCNSISILIEKLNIDNHKNKINKIEVKLLLLQIHAIIKNIGEEFDLLYDFAKEFYDTILKTVTKGLNLNYQSYDELLDQKII